MPVALSHLFVCHLIIQTWPNFLRNSSEPDSNYGVLNSLRQPLGKIQVDQRVDNPNMDLEGCMGSGSSSQDMLDSKSWICFFTVLFVSMIETHMKHNNSEARSQWFMCFRHSNLIILMFISDFHMISSNKYPPSSRAAKMEWIRVRNAWGRAILDPMWIAG